jgi:hypothetical protein
VNCFRGAVMGLVSLPTIERVTVMMNDKENRQMRFTAYGEIERTWLVDALHTGTLQPGLGDYLSGQPHAPRRRILFIRLNQTLSALLAAIPRWRLHELAVRAKGLPFAPVRICVAVTQYSRPSTSILNIVPVPYFDSMRKVLVSALNVGCAVMKAAAHRQSSEIRNDLMQGYATAGRILLG